MQELIQTCLCWIIENTPSEGIGSSPAQRLFGRRTRTLLPTSSRLPIHEAVPGVPHRLKERKAKQTYYYNRGTRELNRLKPGAVVRVRLGRNSQEWKKATVEREVDIRSYNLRTKDGRSYRRNRRQLRQSREPFAPTPSVEVSTDTPQEVQPSSQFPRDNIHSCPSPLSATSGVPASPASPVASSEVSAIVPAGPVASSEVSASVPATTVTTIEGPSGKETTQI